MSRPIDGDGRPVATPDQLANLSDFCEDAIAIRPGTFTGAPCGVDPPFVIGDADGDGCVTVTDLVYIILLWGTNGQAPGVDADVSPNGVVDVADLTTVIQNWSAGC